MTLLSSNRGKLLAGKPIQVGFFEIKPFTLGEMVEIEKEYNEAIGILLLDAEKLKVEGLEDQSSFEIVSLLASKSREFAEMVLSSLQLIVDPDFEFHGGFFHVGERILMEEEWEKMRTVIMLQNALPLPKEEKEEFNPADERAAKMREKIEANKKRIAKLKEKKKDDYGLYDMVSKFCSKSPNTNIVDVWNYTIFQFYSQFKDLIQTSSYEDRYMALINGAADPKKEKLVHWTEKLKEE
jgi:hypothetical protein